MGDFCLLSIVYGPPLESFHKARIGCKHVTSDHMRMCMYNKRSPDLNILYEEKRLFFKKVTNAVLWRTLNVYV